MGVKSPSGSMLGGSWKIWGEFWESFGRVWERFWEILASAGLFFAILFFFFWKY